MPIELSGIEELLAKLQKVSKNVELVKEKALKKGAEVIRKSMQEKAPRGDKLASTQKAHPGKIYAMEHLKDNIIISDIKGEGSEQHVDVGPQEDFFYAKFLEFGTSKMHAQPFAEPGFLEKRNEALEAIADEIRKAVEENV